MISVTPLTNDRVEQTEASVLVDQIHPGQPLLISFGFVNWEQRPAFDFYGRVKKLEATTQKVFNRILVRDCTNSWYHRPIPGLGNHVDEVADSLQQLIARIQPSHVITIGQSMGAYAAILFGILLKVKRIVAFGPLSFLDVKQALTYHDRRWLRVMLDLHDHPPPSLYADLPRFYQARQSQCDLRVIFGTQPDADAPESVNLDVLHAHRYGALPNCQLFPVPRSGHAVVQHLINEGRMDAVLAKHLLDKNVPVDKPELPAQWQVWLQENMRQGGHPLELSIILKQHGFSEQAIQLGVDRLVGLR
jgi:predicted esterase